MSRLKCAAFVATSVAVLCPHCGAEQPSPDNGSDMWEPDQIKTETGRICNACDETYSIVRPSKVAIELMEPR